MHPWALCCEDISASEHPSSCCRREDGTAPNSAGKGATAGHGAGEIMDLSNLPAHKILQSTEKSQVFLPRRKVRLQRST